MNKFEQAPQPLNPQERYMYAMVQRLDALCVMMSDFVDAYGKVNNLATEEVKVVEQTPKKTSTAKSTKKRSTTPRKPRATTTKVESDDKK